MPILTITASGQTGIMSGLGVNDKVITIPMSSFSPQPSSVLNSDSNFLVKAIFNYRIRCGEDDGAYKGDAGLRFDKTSSITHQIFAEKEGKGYQVGYTGFSDSEDVTNYVNIDDGTFLQIYSTYKKSVAAFFTREYFYGLQDLSIDYYYIPYKVSLTAEHGSISRSLVDFDSYTVTLTAVPNKGYHFVRWHDGNTNASRTETITEECEFIAYFEPNTYTVKLYDYTSGAEVLLHSIKCTYDQEIAAPPLPDRIPPEGYGFNSGWALGRTSTPNNIRWGTNDMYSRTSTSSKVAQQTSFFNETSDNNATVSFNCNFHPYQYAINYKKYILNDTTNYTITTQYRIYNHTDIILNSLPTTISEGYKLLNQMNEKNGPIDSSLTNYWFTSLEELSPENEKINQVASTYIGNLDVYSFEVPIDYQTIFNVYNMNGEKIAEYNIPSQYGKDINTLFIDLPEEVGQIFSGWYSSEQDISNQYFEPNSNTTIANSSNSVSNDFNIAIKNLTVIDQDIVYRHGYYIPKSYLLFYAWLDVWDKDNPEFSLPSTGFRVYGRDSLQVELIPNYEEYTIDNVNSINWYYFNKNYILSTNNFETIPNDISENLVFYAKKEPKEREITFSINRDGWGKIVKRNASSNDRYEQGYILEVYAEPLTDLTYFSHWSDGNNQPARNIEVRSHHMNYEAIFRNKQIFAPRFKEE